MKSHEAPAVNVLIGKEESEGRLSLIESVEQRGAEPPCHCHHWEDKVLYVLEGELAVFIGGAWFNSSRGEAIMIPRGTEHTFSLLTETVRLLTLFTPAGFEAFYREIESAPGWSGEHAAVERWVATAARYGCEVTGPHPGYPALSSTREL